MGSNSVRTAIAVAFALLMLTAVTTGARAAGEKFFVIAESVSTSMEARRIIRQQRWQEAPLRQAEYVLVVVRSSLMMPLIGIYDGIGELQRDAENQLNISGPNFVVYIFRLDDNLRPTELKRVNYPARD
jgi:hypothetical protein